MKLILKVVIMKNRGGVAMKEYNLAEHLLELRTKKKKTQKELAEFLGIKQAAYSKYEVGETEPKIPTLIKLAKYYETDLNSLVGFSPISPYEKAKNHVIYNDPNAVIRKDGDKVVCYISRNSEGLHLNTTQLEATEQDFINCVTAADKESIKELEEHYKDRFIMFFSSMMILRHINKLKERGDSEFVSKEKSFKNFMKKMSIPTNDKRKARSDKKEGEK